MPTLNPRLSTNHNSQLSILNSQLIITLNSFILRVVFVFIPFFTIYEKSPFFELKTPHSYYPFIVFCGRNKAAKAANLLVKAL